MVKQAYGAPESDIEGILGTTVDARDPDRAVIEPWAESVAGRILDVGSGTGRWTGHLAELGHQVEGLEPVERLLRVARREHPSVVFHQGAIEDLADIGRRWDGLLAWYSLIHLGPEDMPQALANLRAVLPPDGSLLMSYFAGPEARAFDHPVTTAYAWPLERITRLLRESGFEVIAHRSNPPLPHAYLLARAITAGNTDRPAQ